MKYFKIIGSPDMDDIAFINIQRNCNCKPEFTPLNTNRVYYACAENFDKACDKLKVAFPISGYYEISKEEYEKAWNDVIDRTKLLENV